MMENRSIRPCDTTGPTAIINSLFSLGLDLDSLQQTLGDDARERVLEVVAALDAVITEVRTWANRSFRMVEVSTLSPKPSSSVSSRSSFAANSSVSSSP
jgi:hypothetical protein